MKKTIVSLIATLTILTTYAQSHISQGMVLFEELVKLDIQIDNLSEEMQAMLPKENRNTKVLYFNEEASVYENYDAGSDATVEDEMEGGAVKIMISQPENILFRDLLHQKTTEQTEFMTRTFLIESDIIQKNWKLTGKQKKILEYTCQEATIQEGDALVSVWFTPEIPVPSGPGQYASLPGMVLAMETASGDRSITATSIELKPIDDDLLQKPKKGKKVSQEKFDAIVEDKTKEMGGENVEGGHTVIMKISN